MKRHNTSPRPRPSHRAPWLVGSLALLLSVPAVADEAPPQPVSPHFLSELLHVDRLKPYQALTLEESPRSPEAFNPDPPRPPVRPRLFEEAELGFELKVTVIQEPPLPPALFNPAPGAQPAAPVEPFFRRQYGLLTEHGREPLPDPLQLPRAPIHRAELSPVEPDPSADPRREPLPEPLRLPREGTRANQVIPHDFPHADYPLSRQRRDLPPHTEPMPDRWRVGFAPWKRYTDGATETPYETPTPLLWAPYRQSVLKGDVPVIGQDIFLNVTATSVTEVEGRRIPTPANISAARPDSAEFFGQSEQLFVQNNWGLAVELFRGETAFKPFEWAIRLAPVVNLNYTHTRETGVISPDPRGPLHNGNNTPPPDNSFVFNPSDIDLLLGGQLGTGASSLSGRRHTTRLDHYVALQEAFVEVHLGDLSPNYDFIAARVGNQVFNSDFRGFVFNDINLGARLFGNADNNHYQYNLALFDMREKDTNSELNTFDQRDQRVVVANFYRQDFLTKGYTAQLSFHANLDEGGRHFDRNGVIVRPTPLGAVRDHDVRAYYLGWAGDGHIGRLNVSHAFYQVLGEDTFNGLAGQPVDINAQMAAVELSYDRDWVRYKASLFYASGDGDAEDGEARGFDTILDNPNFTGGPFSFYARQGFNLGGTLVNLKQRNSLVPNLRTSKTQGQANFVNPGVFIAGVGMEIEVTPKLRSFLNANYIRFVETDPIKTALLTDDVRHELGWDFSIGFQYRPLLTDNIIVSTGFGALVPGSGYRDIYRRTTDPVAGFTSTSRAGGVDDFLFSAVLAVTLTY